MSGTHADVLFNYERMKMIAERALSDPAYAKKVSKLMKDYDFNNIVSSVCAALGEYYFTNGWLDRKALYGDNTRPAKQIVAALLYEHYIKKEGDDG